MNGLNFLRFAVSDSSKKQGTTFAVDDESDSGIWEQNGTLDACKYSDNCYEQLDIVKKKMTFFFSFKKDAGVSF